MGLGGGLNSYPVESFAGPLTVVDVSKFEKGFTVNKEVFEELNIQSGQIVIIYTK